MYTTAVTKQKSPILAAIGSFFIPGLGQVYNGEGMLKGLLYFIGIIIGSFILFIPGLIIWLYGVYNAYKVAKDMNAGMVPYKETSTLNLALYIVLYLVVVGIFTAIAFIFSAVITAFLFAI